jgi:hypothetical protein
MLMKSKIIFVMFLLLAFSLVVSLAYAKDLKEGLVGYWPLDENGSDMVGKSKGELSGGANWTKAGRVKGGVELDGKTGCVAISGFKLTTTDLTAIAWLKGSKQGDWAGIMCSRADPMTFWVGFTGSNTLSYVWNNNAANTYSWVKGPVIPQDEWCMIAMTITKETAFGYLYTDADKLKSGENKIPHIEQTIADNLKIGRDECCGDNRHVKGFMDEVMIYNRALSADEITKIAVSGLAVDQKDKLAAQWGSIKQQ